MNAVRENMGTLRYVGRRGVWALVLVTASFVIVPVARAEPAFSITHMATTLEQGVYYLDADLQLTLNEQAHDALNSGVALTFVVKIHIMHHRFWLWNAVDAHLKERYRLRYYPLTERYRVVNLNSGARRSYATLSGALAAISRIRHLPIIDATLLDAGTQYYVAMRVVLDTRQLPGPLKIMASIVPSWQLVSHWRQEPLTP